MVPKLHLLMLNVLKGPFPPLTSAVSWKVHDPNCPPKLPASLGCPPDFLGNPTNHEPFILIYSMIEYAELARAIFDDAYQESCL